jgi:CRISPR-associated protein Cmr1
MPKMIDCPPEPPRSAPVQEERTYRIELITPLFGGGVDAGVNDPTMPIRATAIRGQLQFWWRATRGAAFADLEALRTRHCQVWGATEHASPVNVLVNDLQPSEPVPCGAIVWNAQARGGQGAWRLNWNEPFRRNEHLSYALFPFQGILPRNNPQAQVEEPPAQCIHQATFTLCLRFPPELREEIPAAVQAWVNFGGLGSRTRRGCGALYCRELAPRDLRSMTTWLTGMNTSPSPSARQWPTLGTTLLYHSRHTSVVEAWNTVVGLLKEFRQGRNVGRNPGETPNRPGRSRFPEPETIRRIMETGSNRHEPWPWMPDGFPRAEFGLPIVFHFKDDRDGEPSQTYLYPYEEGETKERMASPIILKPLMLADRKAVPVIVPLVTTGVSRVELQDNKRTCRTLRRAVPIQDPAFLDYDSTDFTAPFPSPLKGRAQVGSALQAFLEFVKQAPRSFLEIP